MTNITTKTKIILFAVILVAMILPFSSIEMVDAAKEKADKKEKKDKKEQKSKKEKKNQIKGNGYTKKEYNNDEAERLMRELVQFAMIPIDETGESKKFSANQMKKYRELQKQLDKSQEDYREKIIDKELRKELKKAHKRIMKSDIPFRMLSTGIDHLYIQLSIDSTLEQREKYETQIAELVQGLPYLLEYNEGPKRLGHSCLTTSATDCLAEVGGLQIQNLKNFLQIAGTCTLSIPIQKDGVDGFLTAAHCFNGYSEDVYQPTMDDQKLGYSHPDWRSIVDGGECDCAWIKDTSVRKQLIGPWVTPGYYLPLAEGHMPKVGDRAMMRGIHTGSYPSLYVIDRDNAVIDDRWLGLVGTRTINLMSFVATAQAGDSGGTVFDNMRYFGIIIATSMIDNELHVLFVPWDHITENISGLTFIPAERFRP